MARISINVIYGNGEVSEDDIDRARDAAMAVLAQHGVSVDAAFAEFSRQWLWLETDEAERLGKFQDHQSLEGLALVWIKAERAADIALTQGWYRPDGASCGISA